MELLASETTNAKGLIVGLNNGEIRLYYEKNLISTFTMQSPLTALKYVEKSKKKRRRGGAKENKAV